MRTRFVAIIIGATLCACGNDHERVAATPTTPTPVAQTPPTTPSVAPTPPVAPAPPVVPARVRGVVLDFQTARPIAGAIVGFASDLPAAGVWTGMTETAVSDANGVYSLPEPPPNRLNGLNLPYAYYFVVDNQAVGSGFPRASNYRADVAIDRGKCVARFGMALDSRTYAPIVGATARSISSQGTLLATTDKNGWYHIDWGCGAGHVGFNTTWLNMSHPDYNSSNFSGGRGFSGIYRDDVLLVHK